MVRSRNEFMVFVVSKWSELTEWVGENVLARNEFRKQFFEESWVRLTLDLLVFCLLFLWLVQSLIELIRPPSVTIKTQQPKSQLSASEVEELQRTALEEATKVGGKNWDSLLALPRIQILLSCNERTHCCPERNQWCLLGKTIVDRFFFSCSCYICRSPFFLETRPIQMTSCHKKWDYGLCHQLPLWRNII